MKEIKVKDVKKTDNIFTVEGKLLLLKYSHCDGSIPFTQCVKLGGSDLAGVGWHFPIIISESESIEVDDKFWDRDSNKIETAEAFNISSWTLEGNFKHCYKILAFSENISTTLLKAISIGRVRHEGRLLIECEEIPNTIESVNNMSLSEERKIDLLQLCYKRIKLINQKINTTIDIEANLKINRSPDEKAADKYVEDTGGFKISFLAGCEHKEKQFEERFKAYATDIVHRAMKEGYHHGYDKTDIGLMPEIGNKWIEENIELRLLSQEGNYELLENFARTLQLASVTEGVDGEEEYRGLTTEDINKFLKEYKTK